MEDIINRHSAFDGRLDVRHCGSLAEMDAIAADWCALETRCGSGLTYFQTFDWCRAWVARFAADEAAARPFILTAWRGTRLVAVWPLMQAGSAGLRRIEDLGEPYSQYSGFIGDPDLTDADVQHLIEHLEKAGSCDVAVFDALPQSSRLARLLTRGRGVLAGPRNESLILDLSGYASSEDYLAGIGRARRRSRARKRGQLAEIGPLTFDVIWPGHPEFAPLVRRGVEMKREWLRETARYSAGLMAEGADDFLASLGGDPETMSGACLAVLRAGDCVVAVELGFLRNGHYCSYLGGFDWELAALSPGKVLMEMTVCWLIDRRVRAYDLLANVTEYKKSWSNRAEELRTFAMPLTWKGTVYARIWIPSVRPVLKRAFYAVPYRVRRLVTGLQMAACLVIL